MTLSTLHAFLYMLLSERISQIVPMTDPGKRGVIGNVSMNTTVFPFLVHAESETKSLNRKSPHERKKNRIKDFCHRYFID